MSLLAIKKNQKICSIQYSEEEWKELKRSDFRKELKMTCCNSQAIVKTSINGLQFFAHKSGKCSNSKGESKEHLLMKYRVGRAAIKAGWKVKLEQNGCCPNGSEWIADVYMEKGSVKIAIEIQLSNQTFDVFVDRQERYKRSGVRCLWLFKDKYFNNKFLIRNRSDVDLPVFSLSTESERISVPGNSLYIPDNDITIDKTKEYFEIEEFVIGALSGKLKWINGKEKNEFLVSLFTLVQCHKCGFRFYDCYQISTLQGERVVAYYDPDFKKAYRGFFYGSGLQSVIEAKNNISINIGLNDGDLTCKCKTLLNYTRCSEPWNPDFIVKAKIKDPDAAIQEIKQWREREYWYFDSGNNKNTNSVVIEHMSIFELNNKLKMEKSITNHKERSSFDDLFSDII